MFLPPASAVHSDADRTYFVIKIQPLRAKFIDMSTLFPVLLAGGLGTRLWPLSREIYPKQLLNLVGGRSLLQQAADRACTAGAPSNVITVTTEVHYFPVRDQLAEIDGSLTHHILLEPEGRNTAAAIAVAALYALEQDADAMLFVAPADHVVGDVPALLAALKTAAKAAAAGALVTFGIAPSRPETGYGYIEQGKPFKGVKGAMTVGRFIEKPDQATAEALIATDKVLWNSGMFVFRADRLIEELHRHRADIHDSAQDTFQARRLDAGAVRFDTKAYGKIPKAPVDTAVMEQSDRVAVVPVDPRWSDVGTWLKIWEVEQKDEAGNVAFGDVVLAGSHNCLVHGDSRLVACAGLDNVVVTETADAVLVAGMNADNDIRAVVDRLRNDKRQEAVRHLAETRPWGSFQVLLEGPRFKIKEIAVKPGATLSLQMHNHRSEHWIVVEGTARTTCDDDIRYLESNQSTFIPVGAKHRLENPGEGMLRIIEVQCGNYVGEDDIVRFDDKYGRASPAA